MHFIDICLIVDDDVSSLCTQDMVPKNTFLFHYLTTVKKLSEQQAWVTAIREGGVLMNIRNDEGNTI